MYFIWVCSQDVTSVLLAFGALGHIEAESRSQGPQEGLAVPVAAPLNRDPQGDRRFLTHAKVPPLKIGKTSHIKIESFIIETYASRTFTRQPHMHLGLKTLRVADSRGPSS